MSIKTKLIVLFLAFAVIPLTLLGVLSYQRAIHSVKDETQSRLDIMADTKTDLVESFFQERRGDIQVAQKSLVLKNSLPILNLHLDDRQNPVFLSTCQEVLDRLTDFRQALKYNDIVVVGPTGRVLCAAETDTTGKRIGDRYPDRDGKMLASARAGIYLSDVYLDPGRQDNYEMAIAAPVQDPAGALLGMVILEIDMDSVFHSVSNTSELGRTGEMVLAKRQGNAVRFISPLRHPLGSLLQQVEPFRQTGLVFPAQLAVTGHSGSGPSHDYRGEDTLAAWRYLPDLGWGLVVKIDTDEVLAPVNRLRDWALGVGLATVLLGALLAWVLGRSITRPLLDLERGAKIIGSGNLDHKIDNPAPDEIGQLSRAFDQMTDRLKTVTASRDELNREIEERKRAEAETVRAKRALYTLSQFNQSLVRTQTEEELLRNACRVLVEDGGYRLCWIGYKIDDPEKTVKPVASAGFEQGYLEKAGITWADTERGRGPTGMAIRSGQPSVCQNFLTDPVFAPWREEAIKRGYASSIALPLFENGKALGALMVYAVEPDAFAEEEVRLLVEMADDLSYGIRFLRTREAHLRADEALRQSDARLRQVVSNAPVILHSVDRDEVITLSEGKGLKTFDRPVGWSSVGKTLTELYGRNPEVMAANRRALAGERFHQDLRIGETILSSWFEPIRDASGEITGAISVSTDVTELRRAEIELRKAHRELELRVEERTAELAQLSRRYRDVTDLTTDYVFQMSVRADGKLAADYVTDRFFELLGYTRDDISDPDRRNKLMIHPEDAHLAESLNQKVLAGRDGTEEVRYFTQDRRIKWIQNYERPLWDDKHEKVIGILGAGSDITERKQAEEELKQHRDRLEELVEARTADVKQMVTDLQAEIVERHRAEEALSRAGAYNRSLIEVGLDPLVTIGADGRITDVNQATETVTGRTREELIGSDFSDYFTDPEQARAGYLTVFNQGLVKDYPLEISHRDGRVTPVLYNASVFRDKDGNIAGVFAAARDITERRQAEADQHEARRIIEEQRARAVFSDRLRSLGEMAAGMAHELNQPLLGVRGLAEHLMIAIDRGWNLPLEGVREKAALIVNQADRMSHVIEHSRMFARGADAADLSPVQVNEVIEAALSLIGSQLRARGIDLQLELEPSLPWVTANPFSLEEVVINLITNARDAIEDLRRKQGLAGELSISIRTFRRQPEDGKGEVVIAITDQGIGMDPKTMEKAFEPFFTTKEMNRGTGLGLSISRSIIQRFNGTIEISSAPGQGATVTLVLPA